MQFLSTYIADIADIYFAIYILFKGCPIVHKLNLVEFAELCISLDRGHMAAVALALCRDEAKREYIKKVISFGLFFNLFVIFYFL